MSDFIIIGIVLVVSIIIHFWAKFLISRDSYK